MALTIREILTKDDRPVERVDCPEWGGHVCIRPITGDTYDRLTGVYGGATEIEGMRAAVVAECICNEDGSEQETEPEDVTLLGQKHGGALNRVYERCMEISGMVEEAIGDAVKNSDET